MVSYLNESISNAIENHLKSNEAYVSLFPLRVQEIYDETCHSVKEITWLLLKQQYLLNNHGIYVNGQLRDNVTTDLEICVDEWRPLLVEDVEDVCRVVANKKRLAVVSNNKAENLSTSPSLPNPNVPIEDTIDVKRWSNVKMEFVKSKVNLLLNRIEELKGELSAHRDKQIHSENQFRMAEKECNEIKVSLHIL